jgi:hypothetical protein
VVCAKRLTAVYFAVSLALFGVILVPASLESPQVLRYACINLVLDKLRDLHNLEKQMRDYALLQKALLDDLQMEEVMFTSDMNFNQLRSLSLKNSFFKKLEDSVPEGANAASLSLFKASNEGCKHVSFIPENSFEDMVIGEVKTLLDNIFFRGPDQTYSISDIMERCTCGPGASLGSVSDTFFTKMFDSSLTGTSENLYRLYRYSIADLPMWQRAELLRSSRHGRAIVAGNRLSFVPKTPEKTRTICTEPVLNMYFQKGLGSIFEEVLARHFLIDLSKQPSFNRELARLGSIDGSFGTIDLSNASDSMSLKVLKEVLPVYVFNWICQFRSPVVTYPSGDSDELHMVSSMGNAFTFPLQTLLFSCIVVACYRVMGFNLYHGTDGSRNFAVFGDDIIVRKDVYHFVVRCLKLFGFTVNDDKSFNSGSFRESCGGDFYKGRDIRGVYIKSLKTRADVYSAINRLIRWCDMSGVLLPRVIGLLTSWVKFLPVPYFSGDTEGIKTPYMPPDLKWNRNLQGVYYYVLEKRTVSFRVPTDESNEYVYPSRGFGPRKKVGFNPDGALISFLGGYVRNGRLSVRNKSSDERSFKIRRRTTSSWHGTAAVGQFSRESSWIATFELLYPDRI